jgi:ubiquinone/menaquinone biosynthesis C-methylase UbiE
MKRMRTLRPGPTSGEVTPADGGTPRPRRQRATFRQDWDSYARLVAGNCFNHAEAYAVLRTVLLALDQPIRFLDIACGDASASAGALAGTQVSHYRGIDLSEDGLARAERTLAAALACPMALEHRDFAEALRDPGICADIAWVGLSLHHLEQPQKLATMRDVRRTVGRNGHLLIYENASPVDETRAEWLERWDAERPRFAAFDDDEWASISRHVHTCDFPETDAAWHELGRAAGFAVTRCLYASPNELFRLYAFGPKV